MNKALLVYNKHKGQLDKAGKPYYEAHLAPVSTMFIFTDNDNDLALVDSALAHDLLEDTDATTDDMKEAGFWQYEIDLVELLTHKPNESLEDYIARVKTSPAAMKIKIADVMSNLERMHDLDRQTQNRLRKKYFRTLRLLTGVD